jgi:hypothetical protein
MKTLRITLFAAAIAMTTMFAGCGGAQGPQGDQGPQGPSGVTGTNAAFISNTSDWAGTTTGSGFNYMLASYTMPIITQDAINTGVVMVYFEATTGVWAPLAYTYPISGSVEQTLTFNYAVGILTLQIQNSDNSMPLAPASAYNYNCVVIPTSLIKQHPGINLKDYNTVKQLMASRGSL